MTRIMLLTTGGTIASAADESGAFVPVVSGRELLDAALPSLPDHISVTVRDLTRLDSSAITLSELDGIIAAVHADLADPDVDGIVITHGTDSMEETALALDIFHADGRPVVLTGAQRSFDHPSSDGVGNLVDAIRLAADPLSRREGVLIAFGGWTIPARGASKRHTGELDAFISTTPREDRRPKAVPVVPLAGTVVPVVAAWPGAGRELIDAAVSAGAQGIVVEALGSGNMGPAMGEGVAAALAAGIPVVVTTRVPAGEVALAYGGAGGGATLGSLGAVGSGYLRAGQSRIALIVALAGGHPIADML
ncbi:L-asparaginase 2 precursor [Corynebacterium atrinae]|uniref:asparaginase n=1 Tax=Corynebacterium atrinae TaxID=1336740 RepID=UPI0025B5F4E1|nr:asparaginase [Corynebacterium atrinae]WJY63799.1 L-asparaginase 2 precursor [Corynebacterium atrinae]